MKTFSRKAAALLIAGTAGLTALAPAMAQDRPANPPTQMHGPMQHQRSTDAERDNKGPMRPGPIGRPDARGAAAGSVLDLVCSERGAERLEHAFVTLSYRAKVTDDQKAAFDDLKATALKAQADFAETCTAAMDAIKDNGSPDILKALQTRLAIDTARVEAFETVLPKFETFYNGLSDEQKQALNPRFDRRDNRFGQDQGPRPGQGPQQRPGQGPNQGQGPSEGQDNNQGPNRPHRGPGTAVPPAPPADGTTAPQTTPAAPAADDETPKG